MNRFAALFADAFADQVQAPPPAANRYAALFADTLPAPAPAPAPRAADTQRTWGEAAWMPCLA